ncbi:aspartate racemase [Enterococcus saigonensis]|uniref:Aspartate racemase n=1 Tax=Enterococcus saigonensis TaxID=1805431 RepID=A0A679IRB5_9ENTE|nr:amino acid racemase [Enterococcus saigonensis]BCA85827.1 aspartate racemase [Enterococcus saigonensis]
MENFFSILGGMGTQATESFVRLLNHRTITHKDQDYLNYVLFNHATVPDRTAYILDETAENPLPFLLDDIAKQNLLKPNFIVLTCNTAHYFFETLQEATKIPILHMPREAAIEMSHRQNGGKVAFLGTEGSVKAGVYQRELEKVGFEVMLPKTQLQQKVNDLIYRDIKENDFLNKDLYYEILAEAIEKCGCASAVLGCTELSLMEEFATGHKYNVVDAQSILVDRTIERALSDRKKADHS